MPLIYGIDAVHGHNNIVGATIFPHNIGLGAARDPDLIRRIGEATALEVAVTGADWTFGPTLAVPQDDRWGRAYEGYAENPEVAQSYAGPMTLGLQGRLSADHPLTAGHIAGSAKHFLADGGTTGGKDQGDYAGSEQEMIRTHLSGYPQAIDAGVLSIMASFSSWNGVKHSGKRDHPDGCAARPRWASTALWCRTGTRTASCRAVRTKAAPWPSTPGSTCSWRPTAGSRCTPRPWPR